MATTTETKASETTRGFVGVSCPGCGEEDSMRVDLADMRFTCSSCDADFTPDHIRGWVEAWTRVLAWVDLAPVVK